MDVDLSTDLRGLLPLVAPLLSGHSDLAIGTRLAHGSRWSGTQREVISRAYNGSCEPSCVARFSDAQCGFKAVRADLLEELLPEVRDDGWFFDTELLVAAQRRGCGSTRCRSTGSTIPTRACGSCAPRWTICAASRD